MFPDDGAGGTAIAYTDQFLEAGVVRLDAIFGAGYAGANPAALAAYLATCASNLNSFMLAASSLDDDALGEALAAFEEQMREPAPKPKGRHR
ncbi:MAG TPA: hypothetical protein VFN28_10095 [Amaricoccus sp.]|nr:hypothetical protein [Amaricoccus sp.]